MIIKTFIFLNNNRNYPFFQISFREHSLENEGEALSKKVTTLLMLK